MVWLAKVEFQRFVRDNNNKVTVLNLPKTKHKLIDVTDQLWQDGFDVTDQLWQYVRDPSEMKKNKYIVRKNSNGKGTIQTVNQFL